MEASADTLHKPDSPMAHELEFEFYQPEGDGYYSCSDDEDELDGAPRRHSPRLFKSEEEADRMEAERRLPFDSPSLRRTSFDAGCAPQSLPADSLLFQPVSETVKRRFSEPSDPADARRSLWPADPAGAQAASWPMFAPEQPQEGFDTCFTDWEGLAQ